MGNLIIEICGDGINLGQLECDDGNKKDGDGCSSECKIEKGYQCTSHGNKQDNCVNTNKPTATLKLEETNLLVIRFSEKMLSLIDSTVLASTMSVTLSNTRSHCKLSWEFINNFQEHTELTRLKIKVYPECSIQGPAQLFTVAFGDTSVLVSINRHSLMNNVSQVRAKKFIYIPKDEALALSTIGTIFTFFSIFTFLLMLGISLFHSTAIGSQWTFINMLQLLSYLPGLNCYIPCNLEVFLTEYLVMKDVAIPFNILPDFSFNPMNYIEVFATDPYTDKLEGIGYESTSFMYNYANELLTWVFLFIIYLVLTLLCIILPRKWYSF